MANWFYGYASVQLQSHTISAIILLHMQILSASERIPDNKPAPLFNCVNIASKKQTTQRYVTVATQDV